MLNRIILIGRLTRDPELRYTPAGVADGAGGLEHAARQRMAARPRLGDGVLGALPDRGAGGPALKPHRDGHRPVIAAAALAEIVLLLYRSRASQQKLEAHFLEGEPDDSPDRPGLLRAAREHMVLRTLVGVAMIALAFAIIGALTTLRMR